MCPGRTERKESSSGAPRKIDGMKSTKVWVIAMEVMKIIRVRGVVIVNRNVEKLRSIIAMRFMWMPGVRPVRVPARMPRRRAIRSSSSMYYYTFETFMAFGRRFYFSIHLFCITF